MDFIRKYSLKELIKYCTNVFSLNTNDYQREAHIQIKEHLSRLLEIETRIKNGEYLELKAPLGSTIYIVDPLWMYNNNTHFETPHVSKMKVNKIEMSNGRLAYISSDNCYVFEEDFGYCVFTDYDEAVSVCEELKNDIKSRNSK